MRDWWKGVVKRHVGFHFKWQLRFSHPCILIGNEKSSESCRKDVTIRVTTIRRAWKFGYPGAIRGFVG